MKKPVLVGILIVAVILGVIVYSSMNLAKSLEVCMTFHGRRTATPHPAPPRVRPAHRDHQRLRRHRFGRHGFHRV